MSASTANGKPRLRARAATRLLKSGVKRGRKTALKRIKWSSPQGYVVMKVANRLFGKQFDEKAEELVQKGFVRARDVVRQTMEARRAKSATTPEKHL
jgi:hypothetical protein